MIRINREIIISVVLFVLTTGVFSQKSNFSITASYPIPLADGHFNDYTGVFDLGIEYILHGSENWELGTSFNTSFFISEEEFTNPTFTLSENILILQPSVYFAIKMSQEKDIRPFVSLGYAIAINSLDFNVANGPPDENEAKGGINAGAGARIDISKKFFVIGEFDYVQFNNTEGGLNLTLSNNFSIARLGLGLKI